jgi:hypothetical protein
MPKAKTGRITKVEMRQRVDTVITLITMGVKRSEIIKYVVEKTLWNVDTRQIDNYIRHANEAFAAQSNIDRQREIGKAIARYEMLFQTAMKVQDYQRALAAESKRCELLGLNAPKEVRIFEDVNEHQLVEIAKILSKKGISASQVFNAMLAELAGVEDKPNGT